MERQHKKKQLALGFILSCFVVSKIHRHSTKAMLFIRICGCTPLLALMLLLCMAVLSQASASALMQGSEIAAQKVESSSRLGFTCALSAALSEAGLTLGVFAITSLMLYAWQQMSPRKSSKAAWKAKQFDEMETPQKPMTGNNLVRQAKMQSLAGQNTTMCTGPDANNVKSVAYSTSSPPRMPLRAEVNNISTAVKSGHAIELPKLLEQAYAHCSDNNPDVQLREANATQLLLAALRACASVQCHREAIAAYDSMAGRIGRGNQSVWSLLLYSFVQTCSWDRCGELFARLCAHGQPSGHDVVNMVRCLSNQDDAAGLRQLLADLRKLNYFMDKLTRNRALACCTAPRSMQLAEVLMSDAVLGEAPDAVAYNTLMKGYMRCGKYQYVFELRTKMEANGLAASEVTFGILLDACFCIKDFERAQSIFEELQRSGLQLNAVHYTSLIKGLLAGGRLEQAWIVFEDMQNSPGAKPDLITYSTVVKAYVDCGDLNLALKVFNQMLQSGIEPDDVMLRSLLLGRNGGSTQPAEVTKVFNSMIENGLKMRVATLTVVAKSFIQVQAFKAALDLIEEAPARFGVEPEPRVIRQLMQACARGGHQVEMLKAKELLAKIEQVYNEACSRSEWR